MDPDEIRREFNRKWWRWTWTLTLTISLVFAIFTQGGFSNTNDKAALFVERLVFSAEFFGVVIGLIVAVVLSVQRNLSGK